MHCYSENIQWATNNQNVIAFIMASNTCRCDIKGGSEADELGWPDSLPYQRPSPSTRTWKLSKIRTHLQVKIRKRTTFLLCFRKNLDLFGRLLQPSVWMSIKTMLWGNASMRVPLFTICEHMGYSRLYVVFQSKDKEEIKGVLESLKPAPRNHSAWRKKTISGMIRSISDRSNSLFRIVIHNAV